MAQCLKNADFYVPLHVIGTDFQKEVWALLGNISYGQTVTYGEIAKQLAAKRNVKSMSAQAIGGVIGHNPISVIVPCHRVIGTNRSLPDMQAELIGKFGFLRWNRRISDQFYSKGGENTIKVPNFATKSIVSTITGKAGGERKSVATIEEKRSPLK